MSDQEPVCSVCIPTYNHSPLLRRTLASIFTQNQNSKTPFEVLVADDSSTDDTRKVLAEFPVKIVEVPPKTGWRECSIPFNTAMRLARGKIVVLQGDEMLHETSGTIDALCKAIQPGKSVAAACRWETTPHGTWHWGVHSQHARYPWPCLTAYWREHLYRLGGFDTRFSEGAGVTDLWFDECMAHYGVRPVWHDEIQCVHQYHPRSECDPLRTRNTTLHARLRSEGVYRTQDSPWSMDGSSFGGVNVLSFCLYGSAPKYMIGAIENCRQAKIFYPGWEVRIHVSREVPERIIQEIQKEGGIIVQGDTSGVRNRMLWRIMPVTDPTVDRVVFRDLDSRQSTRENDAVLEWILSRKPVHIMKEWIFYGDLTIAGGCWGIIPKTFPELWPIITKHNPPDVYGIDERFLTDEVWPLIKDISFIQDATQNWPRWRGISPIGERFDNGHICQDYDALMNPPAPPSDSVLDPGHPIYIDPNTRQGRVSLRGRRGGR